MTDTLTHIGRALVQHGDSNCRVYLMKTGGDKPQCIFPAIEELARQNNYGKIFAKVPASDAPWLAERGYREEARIPGYFSRREDACFMSSFPDPRRAVVGGLPALPRRPRAASRRDAAAATKNALLTIRPADPNDVEAMAALYGRVFPSYPFPINKPEYLLKTMRDNVRYFIAEDQGRLAALSSGEIDRTAKAVEMTDFATLPSHRSRGLASVLLNRMEQHLSESGLLTAYTIARAVSAGINRLFCGAGYAFGGTLVNNTQISGSIESMRVWHKPLPTGGDACPTD